MICLSSKREKGLWTRVGPNSPPVSTKDILELAFVEGVLTDMGAHLDTRKHHQTIRELREAPASGGMGGEPLGGVPPLGCLCLTPFA